MVSPESTIVATVVLSEKCRVVKYGNEDVEIIFEAPSGVPHHKERFPAVRFHALAHELFAVAQVDPSEPSTGEPSETETAPLEPATLTSAEAEGGDSHGGVQETTQEKEGGQG